MRTDVRNNIFAVINTVIHSVFVAEVMTAEKPATATSHTNAAGLIIRHMYATTVRIIITVLKIALCIQPNSLRLILIHADLHQEKVVVLMKENLKLLIQ